MDLVTPQVPVVVGDVSTERSTSSPWPYGLFVGITKKLDENQRTCGGDTMSAPLSRVHPLFHGFT